VEVPVRENPTIRRALMDELPVVIHTVKFGAGITGRELAALVQQVANRLDPHTQFIVQPRYYNGTVLYLGQSGGDYRHIRVIPELDGSHYIRLDETYFRVEVTSFWWGDEEDLRYKPSVKDQLRRGVSEVIEFAAKLKEAYVAALAGGYPVYITPEPIPWETDD
jgi:hypothetical protein